MKKGALLLSIFIALAFLWLPLLPQCSAQTTTTTTVAHKTYTSVGEFYSPRFFPVGQKGAPEGAQAVNIYSNVPAKTDATTTTDGTTTDTTKTDGTTTDTTKTDGTTTDAAKTDGTTTDAATTNGTTNAATDANTTVNAAQAADTTNTDTTKTDTTQAGTSTIVMPKVTGPASADSSTEVKFTLAQPLDKSKLSDLRAWVTVDGQGSDWQLDPSMISDDGKTITMKFDDTLKGKDIKLQFYAIDQNGNKTNTADPVTIKINGTQDTTNTNTTNTNTTNTDTTNTNTTNTNTTTANATYDAAKGTITYKDSTGADKTVNIADVGLSADWMTALTKEGGTLSVVSNADGSTKLIVGSDANGAKKWEYDPSSHLVAHYDGAKGSEKCTVVTSDETYNNNYLWASDGSKDPGQGPDGHFVVQRFNYDASGNLATVDYFAWTSGNRGGLHPEIHKSIFGVELTKARYMYRQDTVVQDGSSTTATDSSSVSADCTSSCNGLKVTTKYFNDPFPVDWDPVLTGKVSKDEYGNYWLDTCDGKSYLLTARDDGFDANKNGKTGADEMNSIDWESLVGKEITVRGHQVASDSEGGLYKDGKKAEMFEVCDVDTTNDSTTKANFEKVAAAVDPTQEPDGKGMIGTETARGAMGLANIFNGQVPTADNLDLGQVSEKFTNELARVYVNNIPAADLAAIRDFATQAMETAMQAAENARNKTNTQTTNTQDTTNTNNTQDAANNNTNTNTNTNTQDAANNNTTTNTNATTNTNTNTTDANATGNVDDLLKKSKDWLKQFGNGGVVATQ